MSETDLKSAEALIARGERLEARAALARVLGADPGNVHAQHLLSTIDMDEGLYDAARLKIEQLLEAHPDMTGAIYNLGVCLLKTQRFGDAATQFERTLVLDPGHSGALYNVGWLHRNAGNFDEAAAVFERLTSRNPGWLSGWEALCETLLALRQYEKVLAACDDLLRKSKSTSAIMRFRGDALRHLVRYAEAEQSYIEALKLNAVDAEALLNLGGTMQLMGRGADALRVYERILVIARRTGHFANEADMALSELMRIKRDQIFWDGLDIFQGAIEERLKSASNRIDPLLALMVCDVPELNVNAARGAWAGKATAKPSPSRQRVAGDRLRVGFISGDFRPHPTAYLFSGVLEALDRSKLELFGYSVGPIAKSPERKRIREGFEVYRDFAFDSDRAIARAIEQDQLDLLIDMMGHTFTAQPGVLALRSAPLIAHFLAFPGSMGSSCIDYQIVDGIVVKPEDARYFDEALVRLPNCYQPQDAKRPLPDGSATRKACGLPEDKFVFASMNQFVKIGPEVFDAYMEILRGSPQSVLWLLEERFSIRARLRSEAGARGIDPDRLAFASREEHAKHMNRLPLADLYLDSWPYGGHTTSSDALWAGVPVLTRTGRCFASRVAMSALLAAGLDELVTHDTPQFIAKACAMAADKNLATSVRRKVELSRTSQPLFNTIQFARHFGAALEQIVDRHARGLPAESFDVVV